MLDVVVKGALELVRHAAVVRVTVAHTVVQVATAPPAVRVAGAVAVREKGRPANPVHVPSFPTLAPIPTRMSPIQMALIGLLGCKSRNRPSY